MLIDQTRRGLENGIKSTDCTHPSPLSLCCCPPFFGRVLMIFRILVAWLAFVFFCLPSQDADAGISPENVIVVVNGDSNVSRTVANHYVAAREIPLANVLVLKDIPEDLTIELEVFRDRILKPVLAGIQARGLTATARVIAYSADFPTSVKVTEHKKQIENEAVKKYQSATASITGMTYFYQFVLADKPEYLTFGSNLYARGPFKRYFVNPFRGEDKELFDDAQSKADNEDFAESAKLWQQLFEKHTLQSALAIRAAEASSQADDKQQALQMLAKAIKAGWTSRRYLEQSESLQGLLDQQAIAKILPLLDNSPIAWQPPIALTSATGWSASGERVPANAGGVRYLFSCMLAVVHARGSSLQSAVQNLERTAECDRRFPVGTFDFTMGGDVRAKTRLPILADALLYLNETGFQTRTFKSLLPEKGDAQSLGVMLGSASVNPDAGRMNLANGAIVDNLTSFGGVFGRDGQTKLTRFLDAGAAISSGTVAEPYALQPKFATPMLWAYYARGVSAIEAYYLTVASPYQLLIVGDPMAQPFAKSVGKLVQIQFDQTAGNKINVNVKSLGLNTPTVIVQRIEYSINGRLLKVSPPLNNVTVNLPDDLSGAFEFRTTLVGFDCSEPRVSFSQWLDSNGKLPSPVATITQPRSGVTQAGDDGSLAGKLKVLVKAPGADSLAIQAFGQEIASQNGDEVTFVIDTKALGAGPLVIQPVASFGEKKVPGIPVTDQGVASSAK